MESAKKIINKFKFPKTLNISFNMNTVGSGLLYNKALLYLIFAISFGNFILEMITGDMYFVIIYILIGLLTSFFNKNMMVVLLMATIFANILKYGQSSVEGFEDADPQIFDDINDTDNSDLDNAVAVDMKGHNDHKHRDNEKKETDKRDKDEDEDKEEDKDEEEDNEDDDSDDESKKKSKKTKGKDGFSDRELQNMTYKESEKMLENQKLLLKNMKEFKPFFDTIKGLAGNFSTKTVKPSNE